MTGKGPFQTRMGRILGRVVFYGVAFFVGLPLAFSQVMVSVIHRSPSPAPAGYQEVAVQSGELGLRGWFAEGDAARPAAVVVHGVGDSLESYLEVAGTLRERGHAVLLIDLRGHGGSEGKYMTLGGREKDDVLAAIQHLRDTGAASSGLLLMGYSMGAVSVLRAGVGQPDVRAVVAEAPFDNYRENAAHHAQLLYKMPRWFPLIPLAIVVAEWRADFDAADVDAVEAARNLEAPLLLVVDGADPRMPESVVRRVYDAHRGPKQIWVAEGVPHVGAILRPDYWENVIGFLEEHGV